MADSGEFTDEKAPFFRDRYIAMCMEGATNLDIFWIGKYGFCEGCRNLEECRIYSGENSPLQVIHGYG